MIANTNLLYIPEFKIEKFKKYDLIVSEDYYEFWDMEVLLNVVDYYECDIGNDCFYILPAECSEIKEYDPTMQVYMEIRKEVYIKILNGSDYITIPFDSLDYGSEWWLREPLV
jgi:hypothetical protein